MAKMSKYVSRPILKIEQYGRGFPDGENEHYAEVSFKLKVPGTLRAFGKTHKLTHLIAFEGDFVWRRVEYLTSTGQYIEAPVPLPVLEEMLRLATVAIDGHGKLNGGAFDESIRSAIRSAKESKKSKAKL